jgi:hypothetical protein
VQEILQAKIIQILSGAHELDWEALERIFRYVELVIQQTSQEELTYTVSPEIEYFASEDLESGVLPELVDIARNIPFQVWRHRRRRNGGLAATMPDLLKAYKVTGCKLLRDRIYASASLQEGSILPINYLPPKFLGSLQRQLLTLGALVRHRHKLSSTPWNFHGEHH